MQLKTHMLPAACFVIAFSSASALAQTTNEDPTQLGTRQIEVRNFDASYDIAYRSAMQALLSLGYSISHSDKTSGILTGSRTVGVTQMREDVKKAKEEMKEFQEQAQKENTARTALGFVPYIGWLAWLVPGSKPPEQNIKEPTNLQITMLLHSIGNKETQIRFKMQKDGEPVWDQATIDRLWVTTQREAMIESGPPPAETPQASNQPVKKETEPATKAAPAKAK